MAFIGDSITVDVFGSSIGNVTLVWDAVGVAVMRIARCKFDDIAVRRAIDPVIPCAERAIAPTPTGTTWADVRSVATARTKAASRNRSLKSPA